MLTSRDGLVSYQPTSEDILWLKRAVQHEGEPRALVAQTLVNGFLWARSELGSKRTLAEWVRAYAQPVNPEWFTTGSKFLASLPKKTPEERVAAQNKAFRREFVFSKRTSFDAATERAVERALQGPPELPGATDYAAAWVEKPANWVSWGEPRENENRFWTRPGAIGWTGYEKKKTGGPMSNAASILNNAIVELEWRARNDPKVTAGVKRSLAALADHWVSFWESPARRALPPIALQGRLERYLAWYARGWLLVYPGLRSELLDPRKIDASYSALAEQALRDAVNTYSSAASAAGAMVSELKEFAADNVDAARKSIMGLGVVVIAGLLAYGWAKRARA